MSMNRAERRAAQRHIDKESARYQPGVFVESKQADWPAFVQGLQRVWRDRDILVQQYAPAAGTEETVLCRLSVNLIGLQGDRWVDGITWDQLRAVKNAVGFADHDAVEVYPREKDVVDVANMRHMWVLKGLLPFAWRK